MKTAIFLAAAAAASGVQGGVHKMKLKKVSLSEQLVGLSSSPASVLLSNVLA